MMKAIRIFQAALLVCIPVQAFAQSATDFGSIAICSKIAKMPKGYQAIECNRRNPLKTCRFTLRGDKLPVEYLIENGIMLDKSLAFDGRAVTAGPFGLKSGDGEKSALSKVKRVTGLAFKAWSDEDEPGTVYHQSDDISCKGNLYNLRLFFKGGVLKSVNVSSLPMM